MKNFPVELLAKVINSISAVKTNTCLTGISIDTRTIQKGDCFFAIKGENFDGHNYVNKAFENGACCAIVNKAFNTDNYPDKLIIKAEDTLQSLADFAHFYRKQQNFKVIAITGSVGKTTTRQITAQVLSHHYKVFQSPANFNNNIGLPITLLSADPDHEIVIAELGSNYPGEIEYLSRIAAPDIAVVTTVAPAHLKGFKKLDNIIQEKLSIATGLRDKGRLIVNENLADECKKRKLKFTTFGQTPNADVFSEDIQYTDLSSSFKIDQTKIDLPLPGPGNVENTIAAWAIAKSLQITIDQFAQHIKTVKPASMRTETIKISDITILADCYNANPASMENALKILSNLKAPPTSRKVFICGEMGELGDQTENLHRQLGENIARSIPDLLITVGPLCEITAKTAKEKSDIQIKSFKDVNSACNNLEKIIKDSDIILVKGSRSAKLELAIEKIKQLFS